MVAAGGGEPRRLFKFAVALAPVWSADGTHLIFLGSREPGKPLTGGRSDRRTCRANRRDRGDQARGASPSPDDFVLPGVWKADGLVLFSARLGDSTNLWQMRVPPAGPATGLPQRVTAGTGLEIHPSAGREGQVVFSVVTNNIDLWSLPIETSTGIPAGPMQRLTDDPATDAYPWFSPDGGKLVFMSNRLGSYDLWVRDMSTGKDAVIAAQLRFPTVPIVTKDGSRVVFPSPARERWFSMPLVGGAARTSTPQVACDGCPTLWDFSADGKWAVYEPDDDIGVMVARDLATGRSSELLAAPGDIIGRLRISPMIDGWRSITGRAESSGSLWCRSGRGRLLTGRRGLRSRRRMRLPTCRHGRSTAGCCTTCPTAMADCVCGRSTSTGTAGARPARRFPSGTSMRPADLRWASRCPFVGWRSPGTASS